jgi:hypothetical protein
MLFEDVVEVPHGLVSMEAEGEQDRIDFGGAHWVLMTGR